MILSSGLTVSHWVSDFFEEILETLISVHFSFLYKYMSNGTSFREEKESWPGEKIQNPGNNRDCNS